MSVNNVNSVNSPSVAQLPPSLMVFFLSENRNSLATPFELFVGSSLFFQWFRFFSQHWIYVAIALCNNFLHHWLLPSIVDSPLALFQNWFHNFMINLFRWLFCTSLGNEAPNRIVSWMTGKMDCEKGFPMNVIAGLWMSTGRLCQLCLPIM